MYCRSCGKEVAENAVVCISCGLAPRLGDKYCQNCGSETQTMQDVCVKCGVRLVKTATSEENAKSRLVAGLLGILLGVLGIHRFYLGYTAIAVTQLGLGLAGILTCGITSCISAIWGLVEGILILTGSTITADSQGIPLKE